MSRFGEALKNRAILGVLFVSFLPVIGGTVLGAWLQDAMVDGWEWGAAGGFVAGGVVSARYVAPLALLIMVIGRHK